MRLFFTVLSTGGAGSEGTLGGGGADELGASSLGSARAGAVAGAAGADPSSSSRFRFKVARSNSSWSFLLFTMFGANGLLHEQNVYKSTWVPLKFMTFFFHVFHGISAANGVFSTSKCTLFHASIFSCTLEISLLIRKPDIFFIKCGKSAIGRENMKKHSVRNTHEFQILSASRVEPT